MEIELNKTKSYNKKDLKFKYGTHALENIIIMILKMYV